MRSVGRNSDAGSPTAREQTKSLGRARTDVKKKPYESCSEMVGRRPDRRRVICGDPLQTIYDLITMVIFAGLVVLFLQRSTAAEPRDHLYQYAPPALGCAIANTLGNKGLAAGNDLLKWGAAAIIVAVIGYIFYVLKPFKQTL